MPNSGETFVGKDFTFFERLSWILLFCVIVSLGLVQNRIPIGPLEFGLTEILFLLLLPVWSVSLLNSRSKLPGRWIWAFAVVYLLTGFVSAVESRTPRSSLKHVLGETYLVLLFLVSAQLIADTKRFKGVISAWIIGTAFASLIALATILIYYLDSQNPILPYLTYHHGSVPAGDFPRVTATFASASLFFNYASVGIVLLLCCRQLGWISRSLFRTVLAGACIAAVFTFSIGLGSFFVVAAARVWQRSRTNSKATYAVTSIFIFASAAWLVLALVALGPYPEAPFVFMIPGIDTQAYPSARFLVWQDTIESIRNGLLLGTGPGNPVCYVTFTNTDGTMSLLTDAHNTFLSVLGERGILGAIAFIITLAVIIRPRSLFKRINTSYPPQLVSYGLRFALAIAFVYQGMVGSFEDAKHLWVLMGIALAANEICVSEEKYKESNELAAI